MALQHTHPLVPVLFIGDARSAVVSGLSDHRIGVIVAESVDRGLRLLKNAKVVAVIYDRPVLGPVMELVDTGTPVVLLASGETDRLDGRVTVLRRDAPIALIADVIHQLVPQPAAA